MQIETLLAFYYGEVEITLTKNGWSTFRHHGDDFSGRVRSLQRRRLIVYRFEHISGISGATGCSVYTVSPSGLKELAKRGEI